MRKRDDGSFGMGWGKTLGRKGLYIKAPSEQHSLSVMRVAGDMGMLLLSQKQSLIAFGPQQRSRVNLRLNRFAIAFKPVILVLFSYVLLTKEVASQTQIEAEHRCDKSTIISSSNLPKYRRIFDL